MSDTALDVLTEPDEFGKTPKDYARISRTPNKEFTTFVDRRVQMLTDFQLQAYGDVKSYGETIMVVRAVVQAVLTHLAAEGYIRIAKGYKSSDEEIEEAFEKWEAEVSSKLTGRGNPFAALGGMGVQAAAPQGAGGYV